MKCLSFGEILWDVYPDEKYLGGASLNFAAHVARHGGQVAMLSAVGRDALGEEALQKLSRWGISDRYVSVLDGRKTGVCLVTLDKNRIPGYDLLREVAYDYIECGAVNEPFDVLYFGTLSLRSKANVASLTGLLEKSCFREIFVDVNIRPPFSTCEAVEFCVQRATILKISREEQDVVAGMLGLPGGLDCSALAHCLQERYSNLKCILITLDSDGAYALDCADGKEYRCGCRNVPVRSTVGAGDSFSAAFLHRYWSSGDIQAGLEHASKVAAFVVSQYDAVPDYCMEQFA